MNPWHAYALVLFILAAVIIVAIALFYTQKRPGDFCELSCGTMVCELNVCKVATGGTCDIPSDCIAGDSCSNKICVTVRA